MKISFQKVMMAFFAMLSLTMNAQINNTKTETVKIFGNCGMCKTKIEKMGSIKNVASVDWNQDTQMAVLTYDSTKTNQDEILKRIASAGYDSEKFLAPDDVYSKLPGCCQYDRTSKTAAVPADDKTVTENQEANQLQTVFDNYFFLKDALVKTDAKTANAKSKELLTSIEAVKMEALSMEVHIVWMKILKDLTADVKKMAQTQDIQKLREAFKTVSKSMYELIKASKPTETVYYQYCPMQDANWLSKENTVKNPYYGSQMLTCGKTIETIK